MLAELKGDYVYFRPFEASTFLQGSISIDVDTARGTATFTHRSSDWNSTKATPEHEGIVFQLGEYIFMLARGTTEKNRMVRLSICRRRGGRDGWVGDGLVLSMRTTTGTPFAAKSIIFKREPDNEPLITEFEDENKIEKAWKRESRDRVWFLSL
ncbi:MAG: hypothetical protein ABW128_17895 [Rhizorhabdus sp.]